MGTGTVYVELPKIHVTSEKLRLRSFVRRAIKWCIDLNVHVLTDNIRGNAMLIDEKKR